MCWLYLWWTNTAMERSTIFNGKIHYKWPFSIAMLVWFTRGYTSILNRGFLVVTVATPPKSCQSREVSGREFPASHMSYAKWMPWSGAKGPHGAWPWTPGLADMADMAGDSHGDFDLVFINRCTLMGSLLWTINWIDQWSVIAGWWLGWGFNYPIGD